MLNEEESSDRQLRAQFRQHWMRSASELLNQPIRSECAKYRQIITSALQADSLVRQRYFQHRDAIALLSQPDVRRKDCDDSKFTIRINVSSSIGILLSKIFSSELDNHIFGWQNGISPHTLPLECKRYKCRMKSFVFADRHRTLSAFWKCIVSASLVSRCIHSSPTDGPSPSNHRRT